MKEINKKLEAQFLKDFELTDAGKMFLEKRSISALENPERLKSSKNVRETIGKKCHWPKN